MAEEEKRPIGFEGLVEEEEGESFTVKFSATDRSSPEHAQQEEINLIEKRALSPEEVEKVSSCAHGTLKYEFYFVFRLTFYFVV